MKRPKWIAGLFLFVVAVGMAIAMPHVTSSYPPLTSDPQLGPILKRSTLTRLLPDSG
jgi:hypothetical protein